MQTRRLRPTQIMKLYFGYSKIYYSVFAGMQMIKMHIHSNCFGYQLKILVRLYIGNDVCVRAKACQVRYHISFSITVAVISESYNAHID